MTYRIECPSCKGEKFRIHWADGMEKHDKQLFLLNVWLECANLKCEECDPTGINTDKLAKQFSSEKFYMYDELYLAIKRGENE